MDSSENRQANGKGMRIRTVDSLIPDGTGGSPLPLSISRGLTPDQQKALNHRTRREILRSIISAGAGGLTAGELLAQGAAGAGVSASGLHFHLGVLSEAGTVLATSGPGKRYRAQVLNDPMVDAVLLLTQASDSLPG